MLDIPPGLHVVLSETQGANVTRYVHSPRGIHAHKDAANNWEWPLQDGLGSVRGVLDNTVVLESRNYDPFGNGFGNTGTSQTNYGFTGELVDGGRLLDLRARRYAAGLGVFASLDPFEGLVDEPMSINGYSYVHGNPVNWTDPSGEICPVPVVGWIACAVAAVFYVGTAAAAILALIWANSAREIAKLCNGGLCFAQPPAQPPQEYFPTETPMPTLPPTTFIPNTPVPVETSPGTAFPDATLPAIPLNSPTQPPQEYVPIATPPAPGSNVLMASRPMPNTKPPGAGGSSLPYTQNELSNAGTIPYGNGWTEAGRALQKHGNRAANAGAWDSFAKAVTGQGVSNNPQIANPVGQMLLDYVISNTDTNWKQNVPTPTRGSGATALEGRISQGIGARLGSRWDQNNGGFIGFVD